MGKKILFVNPYESSLFSFRKEVLDKLIEEKYEIVLCINNTERIEKEYGNKVQKIIDVKMSLKDKGILSNLRLRKTYKQIIKNEKPDLILSFGIKPNVYCGVASKNTPIIANITGLGKTFAKKGLLYFVGKRLYKNAFKNIDVVFFQNEEEKEFFINNKIPFNEYEIIPGSGVNTTLFVPDKFKESENIKFLFASRAIKEKGYDLLLEAIPKVLEKNKKPFFTIVSAEEDVFSDERAMSLLTKYSSNFEIIKRTNDMNSIYNNYHFTVAPSFYKEGMSNILLESLSCGRPIITTNDNSGCKEVLQEGINGFGVTSNDLDSLVKAIEKASLLSIDEIEKMGIAGREFVKKNFDRKIVVDIYLKTVHKFCI